MTRIKVEQKFELTTDEVEEFFHRKVEAPPTPTKSRKRYTILKNLSPNRAAVVNQCKAALVRQYGMKEAARYIRFREESDPRGYQYWLKYQIERTPYMDDYCLLSAAQKWFDGAEYK